jgi:hypothetical protein
LVSFHCWLRSLFLLRVFGNAFDLKFFLIRAPLRRIFSEREKQGKKEISVWIGEKTPPILGYDE